MSKILILEGSLRKGGNSDVIPGLKEKIISTFKKMICKPFYIN